jgi:hypothetical protein
MLCLALVYIILLLLNMRFLGIICFINLQSIKSVYNILYSMYTYLLVCLSIYGQENAPSAIREGIDRMVHKK